MEINAAGYCVHCGTFRGAPGYEQGFQPSAPPPYSGQSSAPPYGGQQSAPPYGGQQYQPDPYQQQPYQAQQPYGGGYPDPNHPPSFAPQVEPPRRRPSTVPLIVLSVVALILVVGIVGVVLIRASESGDNGNNGNTGNGGEEIAAGIDKCVVGKWRVTSAKEKVDDDGGEAEFSATGGTAEFRGDGTGKLDYGSGVTYRGTLEGQPVTITLSGNISFDYTTADNTLTYSNVTADGSAELKVNGVTSTTIPLDTDAKPAKYTCSGNNMTIGSTSEQSITEFRKS
jgi:hypothetical protein